MKIVTEVGRHVVSTVKLPVEHIGGWYETMVFLVAANGSRDEIACRRHGSEQDAVMAHLNASAMCISFDRMEA
jgi:hypothetical protein